MKQSSHSKEKSCFMAFMESGSNNTARKVASVMCDCNPVDCSPPGSGVHGILQQGHWSGLLFPPPGDLPDPGIAPASLLPPAGDPGACLLCFVSSPLHLLFLGLKHLQQSSPSIPGFAYLQATYPHLWPPQ